MADWYFIQGIHRSGTTILGSWLQETGVFRTLTLGDVIAISEDPVKYPEFDIARKGGEAELKRLKSHLGNSTRKFDNIGLTLETFEEYTRLTTNEPPFSHWGGLLTFRRSWKEFYPRNLYRLGLESMGRFEALSRVLGEKDDRPQLYKNPYELANPYIYELDAKHIFIFRDPIEILNSLVKQVQEFYKRKNPYLTAVSRFYRESYRNLGYRGLALLGAMTTIGAHIISQRIINELNTQLDLMDTLDERRYVCVEYAYLCQDENGSSSGNGSHPHRDHAIAYILEYFGLDPSGVNNIKSKSMPRKISLLPAVKRLQPKLKQKLGRYYQRMEDVRERLRKNFQ